MKLRTFRGGVHPHPGKRRSKSTEVIELRPATEMVFPLSQHIGAPAKPVVKKGDEVLRGQMIAEAGGFVSAPIHSSVSGTVTKIDLHRNAVGNMVDCIFIQSDGEYREVEYDAVDDISTLSREDIIKRIQDAGVVGMGGAGFPTHVKLSPKEPEKIDYIIANCAECEPYITADYRILIDTPELLIDGMKIALSLFDGAKGIIAVEDNKPEAIEVLTEACKDEPDIEVMGLLTKYPQGGERQLIYATTGRAINASMLPADAGCIVQNASTLVAIQRAVRFGVPSIERVVTITGDVIAHPGNFLVPCGTNFQELVEAAGGYTTQPRQLISGGTMMGFAVPTDDFPVTKTTSALLCFEKDPVEEAQETACINCGRCVTVCPSRIVPSRLADFAKNGQDELFEKWNGLECIECGSCSYTCPAKRQLAQRIRAMKRDVLGKKRAAAQAAKEKEAKA